MARDSLRRNFVAGATRIAFYDLLPPRAAMASRTRRS